MIKQSSFLKWAQNNKNANKTGSRTWIHSPDVLNAGHVAYLVKFLGNTEVDQPKGINVVKQGIQKLRFSQQLKKSEGGKIPKVELTISVDGVAIQDFKTKKIFHQYPLHRISYCADDKCDKKFFSFIAKEENEKHNCFVFISDKLSQEITLTIGQAFDLAYRRFLETSGKDMEMKKNYMILQKRVQELENENAELREKIAKLQTSGDRTDGSNKNQQESPGSNFVNGTTTGPSNNKAVLSSGELQPPVPPRTLTATMPTNNLLLELSDINFQVPVVGRRLENLDLDIVEDFNPRGEPGFRNGGDFNQNVTFDEADQPKDVFGAEPLMLIDEADDPFGMGDFSAYGVKPQDLEDAIGFIDKRLSEMKDGFSRGLAFGNDDFTLDTLDPLNNKTTSARNPNSSD
ncbi:PTB domain-containing engulfment adapter protein 1-like isoform X2 [Limulus polyphemus]|uniref:PTB domain-containing engulfment adapter protein 1-like isoform X2 n=1 Tax=Limulus polyphemus TaxID=6850 RepID=A0ABM1B3Q2_LIMPO|nr:PTB domain-containing engulfment adapter protein 1-like isoform X2 [Limulus polyphemus]